MQFLCLIHVDRALEAAMTPAEREVFERENREYGEWLADGRSTMFSSLHEPETATIIRSRGDKLAMTDGPYVETKEHLGGFVLIEAARSQRSDRRRAEDPGRPHRLDRGACR